jgi:hypothetical protein
MLTWIEAHGFESLLIYFLFSAFSGGMPTPSDNASVAYRWAFSSLSILNGNIARLIATQFSGSKLGQSLQGNQPVQPVMLADGKPPNTEAGAGKVT